MALKKTYLMTVQGYGVFSVIGGKFVDIRESEGIFIGDYTGMHRHRHSRFLTS